MRTLATHLRKDAPRIASRAGIATVYTVAASSLMGDALSWFAIVLILTMTLSLSMLFSLVSFLYPPRE